MRRWTAPALLMLLACDDSSPGTLAPPPAVPRQDGIALALLIDTSGSMGDTVPDGNRRRTPKIDVAKRCAAGVMNKVEGFARKNADRKIVMGVYEFSRRSGSECRTVVPLGAPDAKRSLGLIQSMRADGDTPIGSAMIKAKGDLDATGYSELHLLVITDGENTAGPEPEQVAQQIASLPAENRASMYFIAFDISASKFQPLQQLGVQLLAASNETELAGTLDTLLTGEILIEKPTPKK